MKGLKKQPVWSEGMRISHSMWIPIPLQPYSFTTAISNSEAVISSGPFSSLSLVNYYLNIHMTYIALHKGLSR